MHKIKIAGRCNTRFFCNVGKNLLGCMFTYFKGDERAWTQSILR